MRLPISGVARLYSSRSKHNLYDLLTSMPKEPKHIQQAQKQRLRIKEKSIKYAPGIVTLQVLGTGARGAPKTLYVFTDQSRYLFNCGEGTQRLAHEHKMKLSKLEHVFITQAAWSNMGGLPGAALTLQDVGVPVINLHGPTGLEGLFHATRRFVVLKDLEIRVADCSPGNSFQDNVMTIEYVPLVPESKSNDSSDVSDEEIPVDTTDYYAYDVNSSKKPTLQYTPPAPKLPTGRQRTVMQYACRLKARAGALSLDKCVRHGVPPGPLLGMLKSGQEVQVEGRTVRPTDVCDPDDPGPVFLVVDCPSVEYLEALVENANLEKHRSGGGEDAAHTVVHFTPDSVVKHPRYREWADGFPPSTIHVLLNDANTCTGSAAVHRVQYKLHLLSPTIFPLLGDRGTPSQSEEPPSKRRHDDEDDREAQEEATSLPRPKHWHRQANTLYGVRLRPRRGADRSGELRIDPEAYVAETMATEGFPEILTEVTTRLTEANSQLTDVRDYPKVTFLGTGSSIPNKTRNTSAILLELSESSAVLLDCGEGTFGQLVRLFGPSTDTILSKLKAVYVSHLHADHHLGLIGLIQGRANVTEKPIYLLAPKQIVTWLGFYDKCFERIGKRFRLVELGQLMEGMHQLDPQLETSLLRDLELESLDTCPVRHCPNAFGVRIASVDPKKSVVYSGDTMPCDNLEELGRNCDVLIHEATMEDELESEARVKMHSTTSQAIEMGRRMNANFTILTHFSQRYAKLPRFNDNFTDRVAIAFDNMTIRLDELSLVPVLYPALKVMFSEHYDDMESKSVRRKLRQQLEREALDNGKQSN